MRKLGLALISVFLVSLFSLSPVLADEVNITVMEDVTLYIDGSCDTSGTTVRTGYMRYEGCFKFNMSGVKNYEINSIIFNFEAYSSGDTRWYPKSVDPSLWSEASCPSKKSSPNNFWLKNGMINGKNYWKNYSVDWTDLRDYIYHDDDVVSFCFFRSSWDNFYIKSKDSDNPPFLTVDYTPTQNLRQVFHELKDSEVLERDPNRNHGTRFDFNLGNWSGNRRWAYLGFKDDFSPALDRTEYTVKSATLYLFGRNYYGSGWAFYEVHSPWSEYTITWNNQPTVNNTPFYILPVNGCGLYCSYNFTDKFSEFWESGDEWFDFSIKPTSYVWGAGYGKTREHYYETTVNGRLNYIEVILESRVVEESYVNSSFESPPYTEAEQYDNFTGTSNNYNIEEENTASIDINVTGTQEALNVTYDNQNALVIYRDSYGFSQNITDLVPYKKTYNITDDNFTVYFDITPLTEDWSGYDASVVWDNHTDDYSEYVPNITVGYRKPIFNVTVNFSSPHYMEEDNDVLIKLIPNYAYAKVNATIIPSAVGSILTPSSKTFTDLNGYQEQIMKVKPNYLNYTQFTMNIQYNSKTQSNGKLFIGQVNKTYRYPLYNLTVTYPTVMYITENNTVGAKLMPNAFYQYAEGNITLRYSNEISKVYFQDDYDQFTLIEVSVPFEKTYIDTYDEINANFTVTPLTTDYVGYTIDAESDNPIQEITFEVNKSEYLPDPDYVDVRYRYSPIEYPLENKTLMLQFHDFNGNWEEVCPIFNETEPWSNCINLTIECRTCSSESEIQLVQYWTNETDCGWFNETLQGIKYWRYYPVRMILQDKDVCNDTSIVTSVFPDMESKGSLKALGNRDKYVFHNSSMSGNQKKQYSVFADAIGFKTEFNTGQNKTKVKDREDKTEYNDTDTYVAQYTLEDSKVTFYIANQKAKTVWVDEIRVPDTLAWGTFKEIKALYTTHGKKKIDVVASYDEGTDTVMVVPKNSNKKIPIEPATGSNILIIQSPIKFVGITAFMLGFVVPIMLVLCFMGWGSKYFLKGLTFDRTRPFRAMFVTIGLIIIMIVAVVMMQYFVVALMGLV